MPTVGEILSTERRRQGKQLADVVEGTKIRGRLLDSLEQGRYDDLPSPAYVKGYIQSYARYLEIPAEPLLEQFKVESANIVRRDTPIDRYLAAIPKETVVPRRGTAHEIPRNVWIIAASGIALVAVILFAVSQCSSRDTGANTNPTVPASNTASSSPGATSSVAATSTTTQGDAFTLRVSVRAGMASAVKVTVDGLVGFDGTMQAGESREFRVNQKVVLVIGKPDAVVVTRDGDPVTVPSNAGAKVTLTTGS